MSTDTQPTTGPARECSLGCTLFHMCVDIEGVMRRSDKELGQFFKGDDGEPQRGSVVRDWLKLQLAQGKRVLPMGKKCEGWSDETGCPGHPKTDSEALSP